MKRLLLAVTVICAIVLSGCGSGGADDVYKAINPGIAEDDGESGYTYSFSTGERFGHELLWSRYKVSMADSHSKSSYIYSHKKGLNGRYGRIKFSGLYMETTDFSGDNFTSYYSYLCLYNDAGDIVYSTHETNAYITLLGSLAWNVIP